MGERSDRCDHVSLLSGPLFPNFASTLKPRIKLQKVEKDFGNGVGNPFRTQKIHGLGADRILELLVLEGILAMQCSFYRYINWSLEGVKDLPRTASQ